MLSRMYVGVTGILEPVVILCAVPGMEALMEIPATNVIRVAEKDKNGYNTNYAKMEKWWNAKVRQQLHPV